jgi:hypothetical protein
MNQSESLKVVTSGNAGVEITGLYYHLFQTLAEAKG